MDVIKKQNKNSILNSKLKIACVLGMGMVALLVWAQKAANTVSLSRKNILVEQIELGDLTVTTDGYGVLSSNKQQLLTALTQATVKEVLLKPGAQVDAGSVIVRLDNPQLVQELSNEQQELVQIQANLRQLKLNNQRELLNESANLAELKARYESSTLNSEAQQRLIETGVVSQLTFQQSLLDVRQLKERIDILQQRIEQLRQVHQESINIVQERVKQQQGQVTIAQSRLAALDIKAGFTGVLQALHVELGQSLMAGQEIALVGSVTDLIALVRVPQSQIQQVAVGQTAIINTRQDKIEGRVSRIDPIVADNTVEVEIALPSDLPASARPQLNVDAEITAETLKQVHYIKRPANTRAHSEIELYRLDQQTATAHLHTLTLGKQAGRYIEVVSGASEDDLFIISDLSNLKNTVSEVTITQ